MEIETDEERGRIFFSRTERSLEGEDEICLLSAGFVIGSSTSHLVFSRIVLERLDSRHVVTEREAFYQSDILPTPYSSEAPSTPMHSTMTARRSSRRSCGAGALARAVADAPGREPRRHRAGRNDAGRL
jgi:Ethanolamine utilisation protein EutA